MRVVSIVRGLVFVLIVAGTTILAESGQTAQPGQMTQARVWVQNRGRAETIPVDIREINLDSPMKVQVINGDAGFRAGPVQVTEIRKMWDYKTIVLAPTDNIAAVLSTEGTAGWETTGIAFLNGDKTTLLLKRPR